MHLLRISELLHFSIVKGTLNENQEMENKVSLTSGQSTQVREMTGHSLGIETPTLLLDSL